MMGIPYYPINYKWKLNARRKYIQRAYDDPSIRKKIKFWKKYSRIKKRLENQIGEKPDQLTVLIMM